jgi:hypothetical protein
MIDAVGVADERIGHAAEIEQAIPVRVVARQARYLQPQDDADVTERHFGGHVGETGALGQPRTRKAEILIEDFHLPTLPTELDCSLGQTVLPFG